MTSMEFYEIQLNMLLRSFSKRRRREGKIQIPNDVVEEIMVRLPVRSLIRFQIVSTRWRSLFRSTLFQERYMAHQKGKDPKLLFVCEGLLLNTLAENKSFLRLQHMTLEVASAYLEITQNLKSEKLKEPLEICESCDDGLVCIYSLKKIVEVINPAMGKFHKLPLAKIQKLYIDHPDPELEPCRLGFGKDSVTGRYKLVWLYNIYPATSTSLLSKKKTRCEVLAIKDKKWRFVSTRLLDHHHILCNHSPAFANGSFYWLTGDEQGEPSTQTKLIVFDIHTEMFQVTETPPFVSRDAYGDKIGLCNLDGRLCMSELKGDCKQEFWWRVKDNTWEKIFSVDLRTSTWFGGITWQPLTPLAISRDNNKVILSLANQDNLVAFDLDDPGSTVCHLYFSGFYGLAVPYFPSLSLFFEM